MRRSNLGLSALAATLLASAGCDAAHKGPGQTSDGGSGAAGGGSGGGTGGSTDPGATAIDLVTCTRCHGDPANGNAAPPLSVSGVRVTTAIGVGAHQAHLTAILRAPLRCDDCHVVPENPADPGHMVGPSAAVDFAAPRSDGLARAGGAVPRWQPAADRKSGTCSNVYCHGATLGAGGRNTTPEWTLVDGTQKTCTSCHGVPPTSPGHPVIAADLTLCSGCHPNTVDKQGKILANGLHIDGKVDAAGGHPAGWADPAQHGAAANASGLGACQTCHGTDLTGGTTGVSCDRCHTGGTAAWRTSCTFCHGDVTRLGLAANQGAPPRGAAGQTATTDRAVGAHQSHLLAGPLAQAIGCSECHTVPTNVLDAKHANGKRDLTFGTLATSSGAAASFDAAAATCATYCHGATLAGGSGKTPAWTGTFTAGATTLACGSCHGTPPPTASGVHAKVTQLNQCATCHAATVDATGAILVAGGKHVNGAVDHPSYHPAGWYVASSGGTHPAAANQQGAGACTGCHGDIAGNGGYVTVACADCHKPGGSVNDFGTAAAPACTGCHGVTGGTATPANPLAAAPPRATTGNARPVGAHQAHLVNTNLRASPIACAECHALPQTSLHSTGAVDFTWGALATGGATTTPSFDTATLTCANYCHGSPLNAGGSNVAPRWTETTATAGACGTCHGLPPPAPHPTVAATTNCSTCHTGYSGTPGGTTWVLNKAIHMNGRVDATGAHDQSVAFTLPQNHGLMAIDPVQTAGRGPQYCAGCHLGYGSAGTPTAANVTTSDCNACHAAAGHATWTSECTFCHGDPVNGTGAPPRDHTVVKGVAQPTTLVTVGAHTSHVGATHTLDAAMDCTECHVKPSGPDATLFAGHIDKATADVVFGATAKLGGAVPGWTRATATCASTYCHGATLAVASRGTATTPIWTTVNGSQATCGSCHKSPPSDPRHVSLAASAPATACNACHNTTVDAAGAILTAGGLHIDGAVQTGGITCHSCHGDAVSDAPPKGTHGETLTSTVPVGAHRAHLNAVTLRSAPFACGDCHPSVTAMNHADGTVQTAFTSAASTGTVWTKASATCTASGCHGASGVLRGGTKTAPVWTTVDGSFKTCDACHGDPPPAPHVQNTRCSQCHTGYGDRPAAGPFTLANQGVNPANHLNRTVDVVALACTTCHGGSNGLASNDANAVALAPAPPARADGSNPEQVHAKHLAAGPLSGAFACAECHGAAVSSYTTAHASGTVNFVWGALATKVLPGDTRTVAPAYSTATGSCASTYCHGNFKNGNAANAPVWTNGAPACTSCHGSPPGGTHPANAACQNCHTGYTATTVNAATHVNGVVDTNLTCASCHGTAGRVAVAGVPDATRIPVYPPASATGSTVSAGAHTAHVNQLGGSQVRSPMACSECHAVPTSTAHSTGVIDMTWGALARTGAVAPAFTPGAGATAATCANYCHGRWAGTYAAYGANATIAWNAAATTCTSCHGAPPATLPHPPNAACGSCHGAGYAATSVSGAALATHVDGLAQIASSGCTACHGDLTALNTPNTSVLAAPGANANAVDAHGNPATATATARGVGAHARHLVSTTYRGTPMACGDCHAVPATGDRTHANGNAQPTFPVGGLARAAWPGKPAITPAYTAATGGCSASYCHGNFTNGANAAPLWTAAGTVDCTSCHGTPGVTPLPGGTHPANNACGTCHDVAYTWNGTSKVGTVNATQHLNGVLDLANLSCTSCHGTSGRIGGTGAAGANPVAAAPPAGTKGEALTTQPAVGAHLQHLANTVLRSTSIACNECHAVPTSTSHATGAVTFAWGALATKAGTIANIAWNGTAFTCSNTYCHGNFAGGSKAVPVWTGTFTAGATTLSCTSCHGDPPSAATGDAAHPASTACSGCHSGYSDVGVSPRLVNATAHLNGTVDVANLTCTTCHGTNGRANGAPGAAIAGATYDANQAAAPPIDAKGATTGVLVGTHQAHANPQAAGASYKPVACTECHPNNTSTTHSNGVVNVTFATATGANLGGVVPAFAQGNGTSTPTTCTVYCHGSSLAATTSKGARASWAWDGPVAACGDCHLSPPTTANHHNAAALTTCSKCHGGTVDATGAVLVSGARHINGTVDTQGLTCTTCHGGTAPPVVAGQDANVAAAPTGAGAPDTFGNTAIGSTSPGVGVHLAHVGGARSKPVLCNACHVVPTTPVHKTGAATAGAVAFANLATTGGITTASYVAAGAKTCSNTYCHGNFTGGLTGSVTPAWTVAGTLGCNACHGTGTGATANPPPLPHPQNPTCGTCHAGYTATTVNVATHVNGVVDQTGAGCTQCHGTPGRTTFAAEAPPIDTKGNSATTARGVGAHATHLLAGGLSNPIACGECHVVPPANDKAHANGTPLITFGTLAKTGTVTPTFDTTAVSCASVYCHGNFKNGNNGTNGTPSNAPVWTGTAQAACGTCHAIPPPSTNGGTHPAVGATTNCGSCHTGYNALPGSTNGVVNLALHVNGSIDASGGEPATAGTSCGGCHGTIFAAMTTAAAGAKVTKHFLGGGDAPSLGGGPWTGSTLKGNALYATANCVNMCHGDHPHEIAAGGSHEYNVHLDPNARSATATTATRSNKDFDATHATGGLCTSCHQTAVDATHPAVSKATFQGTAHDYASNAVGTATYTWQYTLHQGSTTPPAGNYQRNCTKCHASQAEGQTPTVSAGGSATVGPHYSDFGSLLAGTTTPGATPANLVCYNCHGNGTVGKAMSGKDLATAISRSAATSGGAHKGVNSDTVHASSSEAAATWNNGAYATTRRHVNCLDCHDEHAAKAGLVARATTATSTRNALPPSMTGATGLTYSTFPALPTAACAANATLPNTCVTQTTAASFSTSPGAATLEYQVCFKCHSSFAFGNTTFPTGVSGLQETDVAAEFSPTNKSGHPVVTGLASYTGNTAPKALVAAQLLAPWNVNVGTQTMLCSDCHNTDAASPAAQGPHGSAITFMLTGANRAWPYTVAGANSGTLFRVATSETGINTQNGLFCRNCHPQQNSAGSNSVHRNTNITGGQHGGGNVAACTSCHIRVPHGGKISRLFVTTNAPARYKVGTPNFAQVTKNATKDGYGTSFPTGFKSSCGQHSSGTGTELW